MNERQFFRRKVVDTNALWYPELTEKAKELHLELEELIGQKQNLEISQLSNGQTSELYNESIQIEKDQLESRADRLDLNEQRLELSAIRLTIDNIRLQLDKYTLELHRQELLVTESERQVTARHNELLAKQKENRSNIESIDFSNILKLEEINKKINELEGNFTDFYRKAIVKPYRFKRIAVLLVGHYRTFLLCRANMMHFFSSMAEQVDYYFVTWKKSDFVTPTFQRSPDTKELRIADISIYFGTLLKGLEIVDEQTVSDFTTPQINNSEARGLWRHLHLSYLAKKAQQLKKDYEIANNFVYDQVIETRPDFYYTYPTNRFYPCKDNEFILMKSGIDKIDGWGWGDGYIRTTSSTNDFLSNRHDFFLECAQTLDSMNTDWMFNYHKTMNAYLGKFDQLKQVTDNTIRDATNIVVMSESDIPAPT
jgi:hypothetical protein